MEILVCYCGHSYIYNFGRSPYISLLSREAKKTVTMFQIAQSEESERNVENLIGHSDVLVVLFRNRNCQCIRSFS